MIEAITKTGERIGNFGGYIDSHMWLLDSNWAVVDMNKPLRAFQRDGGVVTLEPINAQYLNQLHIK